MLQIRILRNLLKIKFPFIKFAMFCGNVLIPTYVIILLLYNHWKVYDWLFALFVIGNIVERAWETFKTSKEKKREEVHGDWTLVLVTYTYIILNLLFVSEYFMGSGDVLTAVVLAGVACFAAAVRLRWWGMAALGSQWAIHAVGAKKIMRTRVIKLGPYKYIRHPIYLGIMLEELGLCLIANASLSLIFCVFVCIPSVIIRAIMEERDSVRRFGDSYRDYQAQVSRFFPWKYLVSALQQRRMLRDAYAR